MIRRIDRVARWTAIGALALFVAGAFIAARPQAEAAAATATGKKLYENLGCGNCHQIAGQGGQAGPKLDGTGKRRDAKWLTQKLVNPKATNPNSIMPPIGKPAKDTKAVVDYLMSLK
jgi:mono/diheme cytochrome c family protein